MTTCRLCERPSLIGTAYGGPACSYAHLPEDAPFYKLAPGEMHIGPAEYVGAFPVRTEIEVLPTPQPRVDPEMAEHGSCLIRTFAPAGSDIDNTLGADYHPKAGDEFLVRAASGGWWVGAKVTIRSRRRLSGTSSAKVPFIQCGKAHIPMFFDEKRQRWAVMTLVLGPECSTMSPC